MLRVTDDNGLEINIFLPLPKYNSFSVTYAQLEMRKTQIYRRYSRNFLTRKNAAWDVCNCFNPEGKQSYVTVPYLARERII